MFKFKPLHFHLGLHLLLMVTHCCCWDVTFSMCPFSQMYASHLSHSCHILCSIPGADYVEGFFLHPFTLHTLCSRYVGFSFFLFSLWLFHVSLFFIFLMNYPFTLHTLCSRCIYLITGLQGMVKAQTDYWCRKWMEERFWFRWWCKPRLVTGVNKVRGLTIIISYKTND